MTSIGGIGDSSSAKIKKIGVLTATKSPVASGTQPDKPKIIAEIDMNAMPPLEKACTLYARSFFPSIAVIEAAIKKLNEKISQAQERVKTPLEQTELINLQKDIRDNQSTLAYIKKLPSRISTKHEYTEKGATLTTNDVVERVLTIATSFEDTFSSAEKSRLNTCLKVLNEYKNSHTIKIDIETPFGSDVSSMSQATLGRLETYLQTELKQKPFVILPFGSREHVKGIAVRKNSGDTNDYSVIFIDSSTTQSVDAILNRSPQTAIIAVKTMQTNLILDNITSIKAVTQAIDQIVNNMDEDESKPLLIDYTTADTKLACFTKFIDEAIRYMLKDEQGGDGLYERFHKFAFDNSHSAQQQPGICSDGTQWNEGILTITKPTQQ